MSSFNGSGTFQISGVGLPYTTGTIISSSVANQLNTDLAAGLSTCILKDGTQSVTANIPFNNYNINNISAIGVGTTAPLYPLHIKSGATDLLSFTSAGNLTISGTNTAASFVPTSSTAPTNGMYLSAANTLAFSTNSSIRLNINSSGVFTFSGSISSNSDITTTGNLTSAAHIPTGSVVPTNGMYLSAANTVAFATNSAIRFSISSTGNTVTTGTNTSASFIPTSSTAPTNGMYLSGTNTLSFATNSASRFTISSVGDTTTTGISTAGSFVPTSSTIPTYGMYLSTASELTFAANSTKRLTVNSAGNVLPTVGATAMTQGFMCIASASGPPTNTPSISGNYGPLYFDNANSKLYIYNTNPSNLGWKQVTLT